MHISKQSAACVYHVTAGLAAKSGGTSRVIAQLTDSLAEQDLVRVGLVSQTKRDEQQVTPTSLAVKRYFEVHNSLLEDVFGYYGRKALTRAFMHEKPHLVHNHGIWHPMNHWAAGFCRRYNVPLISQPHGMLEPWALSWRSWKKSLALWLYQTRDLDGSVVLLATAEQEAEAFRKIGLRQPIAVIPNGVRLSFAETPPRDSVLAVNQPKKALFLSRVHPKKGLLNLLTAWATVNPSDWVLQIAGPDEGGHLAEVQNYISALGLEGRVQYLGVIDDIDKSAVYSASNLFVLPSFSENFGVVVAEALAHGLPVITTRGTPWRGLEDRGCGWWVDSTVDGLVGALRDALTKKPMQLQKMGAEGKVYAREFDWKNIALMTAELYMWALGYLEKPSFVYAD